MGSGSGAGCPPANSVTVYPPVVVDAGHVDAGNPCTSTVSGCTTTTKCDTVTGSGSGATSFTEDTTQTVTAGVVTGTVSYEDVYANQDAAPLVPLCSYSYSWSSGTGAGSSSGSSGSGSGS